MNECICNAGFGMNLSCPVHRPDGIAKSVDPLFQDRTAQSAAWQLALVLAEATEGHLKNLEWPRGTPIYRQRQYAEIAWRMVYHCNDLSVPPRGFGGRHLPLLTQYLSDEYKWWRDEGASAYR